jgi:hypothetical protein
MKLKVCLLFLLSPLLLSAKETWIIKHVVDTTQSMLTADYYDSSRQIPLKKSLYFTFKIKNTAFLEADSIKNEENGKIWFGAMNEWGLLDYRPTVKALRKHEPYNPLTNFFVDDFLLSGCNLNSKSTYKVSGIDVTTWVFSRE